MYFTFTICKMICILFCSTVNEATDEFDAGGGGEEFRPADEGEIQSPLWFVSQVSDNRKAILVLSLSIDRGSKTMQGLIFVVWFFPRKLKGEICPLCHFVITHGEELLCLLIFFFLVSLAWQTISC